MARKVIWLLAILQGLPNPAAAPLGVARGLIHAGAAGPRRDQGMAA